MVGLWLASALGGARLSHGNEERQNERDDMEKHEWAETVVIC